MLLKSSHRAHMGLSWYWAPHASPPCEHRFIPSALKIIQCLLAVYWSLRVVQVLLSEMRWSVKGFFSLLYLNASVSLCHPCLFDLSDSYFVGFGSLKSFGVYVSSFRVASCFIGSLLIPEPPKVLLASQLFYHSVSTKKRWCKWPGSFCPKCLRH